MAFTLDGHTSAQNNNNFCTASLTTSNSGDRVVAQITYYSPSGLAGMTESVTLGGVAMTQRGAIHLDQSGERGLSIWWADAASPLSSAAIVANPSIASTAETSIVAFGAYNGGATIAWDSNSSLPAAANGTSGNPSVSGVSTTGANDLLLGFILTQGSGAVTAGSGFTLVASSETLPNTYSEYQAVSSAQSGISVGATVSSTAWVMVADALTTGGGANNGSLAESFADFTLAGVGKADAHGSLAVTWANFTLSGAGKATAKGQLAVTFPNFTLAGTGRLAAKGQLAATFGDFTLAGTGRLAAKGSLASTFPDFTLVGTGHYGASSNNGALAVTWGNFTLAGVGRLTAKGTLTSTFGPFRLLGTGRGPPPPAIAPAAPSRPGNVPYALGIPGGAPGGTLAAAMQFTRATVAMSTWVAQAANVINNLSNATARSSANVTVAVPGSVTATSPTYKMLGLGYHIALAPYLGTAINLTVNGSASDATLSDLVTLILTYGIGNAPLNGAALTGKQAGAVYSYTQLVASAQIGFFLNAILQGLTVSTSYWFDLAVGSAGGHTVTFGPVNIAVFEQ